jgi:N-acetylmuramoyl-L-alanine amidase
MGVPWDSGQVRASILKNSGLNKRALWRGTLVALMLCAALPAFARHKSQAWADAQFATAEHMREALNHRPPASRTRSQYQRTIDAYRRVYYGSPTSTKAASSVATVADLMMEMGRRFDDDKLLRSAIGQYKFLRREYPGSKDRVDALYNIGQIYQDDLHDSDNARAAFEEFLRHYPHSHLADDARKALAEPVQQASRKSEIKESAKTSEPATNTRKEEDVEDSSSHPNVSADHTEPAKSGKLARVTGIRHWSSPDYTRVAIDVDQGVKFESQRMEHPNRIVFDLLSTRLASTLSGKTFEVDDGYLQKIRVGQYRPGRTRVVLEVNDQSEYEASLAENPTRLIIDVHSNQTSKDDGGPVDKKASTKTSALNKAVKAEVKGEVKDSSARAQDDDGSADDSSDAQRTAKADESKPEKSRTVTVMGKNGVPKTIVDDDPDDHDQTAKLEPPPEIKPSTKAPSSRTTSRHSRSARSKKKAALTPDVEEREAQPNSSGDRSLIRALGLKIGKIVIDPGHGGHDTGTIGPKGLLEKDLVLDVSKRLGKLLEARLGAEVVFTRDDDTFVPLETRTAIANREQADLFVSVHANSSRDPDARGVETYYLNFTSSPDALEVAARENAASDKSIHELQDLVKKIALKEKIEESREFAGDVENALHNGLAAKNPGIRDRGVKKAPFIVLIGANMPSILAEISFVSNPSDERRLRTPAYRQRIAESLYRGIAKYCSGLSGVKVASKTEKDEGQ